LLAFTNYHATDRTYIRLVSDTGDPMDGGSTRPTDGAL
jgi:hypothetical protein